MLFELRARSLGVIEELNLVLQRGLNVLTGETGAGKTLVVDALELLLGGRAGGEMLRSGASEAVVEGRFVQPDPEGGGDVETVLCRIVPAEGRARAFVDGRMAPVSALVEHGALLVDLYGQHSQQALLGTRAQREALDRFAGSDREALTACRRALREIERRLDALGGDSPQRQREASLIGFQLEEIRRAGVLRDDEDDRLAEEESVLCAAVRLREAAEHARELLAGGESATPGSAALGARDLVGGAVGALRDGAPFEAVVARLSGIEAELSDLATDLRRQSEGFSEDPARLAEVRERRNLLHLLCRKYDPTLSEVVGFADSAERRLAELGEADSIRLVLEEERKAARALLTEIENEVGEARRTAAPALARAVEAHLKDLALERAQVVVEVPEFGLGDEVEIRLAANPGEAPVALSKAASGGELSRIMLALRLVLSDGPPTYVFDEVDAGIGGATGAAIGRALAQLARTHQVIVVTHLAQVAAFADHHLRVRKREAEGRTLTEVAPVAGDDRLAELARMLSGHPESEAARAHARELLAEAERWSARTSRQGPGQGGDELRSYGGVSRV